MRKRLMLGGVKAMDGVAAHPNTIPRGVTEQVLTESGFVQVPSGVEAVVDRLGDGAGLESVIQRLILVLLSGLSRGLPSTSG
jgi:hypothetical protein